MAVLLLGIGLGGFFDGIVLHQLLQWHHVLSSWYPPTTMENLRLNTLWDGIFHSATYVVLVLGLYLFWRSIQTWGLQWSGRRFMGAMLVGWGAFNLVEGLIDHAVLGVHHVNEQAARSQWFWWDAGFLAWGAVMVAAGAWLMRAGGHRHPASGASQPAVPEARH